MEERLERLEAEVEHLAETLVAIEQRLSALEEGRARFLPPEEPEEEPAGPILPRATPGGVSHTALVGRTVMVLGGAYLLRALTESGLVPRSGGVVLGLLYALVWLYFSDRAAGKERPVSAAFHGVGALIIAYPLLWEAASRFGVLSPVTVAVLWGVVTALGLTVAWRRCLRSVVWLTIIGAVVTAWALMISLKVLPPFVAALVALGLVSVEMSHRRPWPVLPWITAIAADLAVLLAGAKALLARGTISPLQVLGLDLALFLLYAALFSAHSLLPGWKARSFELLQTVAVAAIGYGGALHLSRSVPGAPLALGVGSVVLAVPAFAAAFAHLGRRTTQRHTFLYHSAVGFLLVLGGTTLLLTGAVRTVTWAVLVVLVAWLARRHASTTLSLESALFAIAAALSSGLLAQGAYAFAAPAAKAWPPVTAAHLALLVAIGVASILGPREGSPLWGRAAGLPRLLLLSVLVWGGGGALLAALRPAIAGEPGATTDPAALAVLRTAVLSGTAVLLAWVGRRFDRLREAAWLVYPVLVAGGVKILLEDFPTGRAEELFVALGLYGGALIVAPRLLSRRQRPPAP